MATETLNPPVLAQIFVHKDDPENLIWLQVGTSWAQAGFRSDKHSKKSIFKRLNELADMIKECYLCYGYTGSNVGDFIGYLTDNPECPLVGQEHEH